MFISFCRMLILLPLLSGCAATEIMSRNLPSGVAESVHIYSRNEEPASNLIDRALAGCPDETEEAETACVKDALSTATVSVGALASSIPGCSVGSICSYDHTTRRSLGLIPMYATVVKKDWRVTVDLRQGTTGAALPPVTVRDRNVFVVVPKAAAVKVQAGATAPR